MGPTVLGRQRRIGQLNREGKWGPIGPYKEGPIGPYGAQTEITPMPGGFTPMPGGLGRPAGENYSTIFQKSGKMHRKYQTNTIFGVIVKRASTGPMR